MIVKKYLIIYQIQFFYIYEQYCQEYRNNYKVDSKNNWGDKES